ncbi:TetR family transcriptional regulator [Microbacterium faecale]|uniref:TetR family transcriptional regulator n=1 Tax=Microbacterium faecale TaxID=1804630 RepID=A0A916Y8N2_9MICO|nr:TetR/AcrR family transcriptional regulator [Microbacterium faecale]GGD34261.1 TetR family transcriptional regulator [Microbacterium faecale]HJB63900.1 TetR/AcrR family transcriptional regulator [Candidatus Microbacterium pullistercoris]
MATPSSTQEPPGGAPSTRERILGAAATIMRRDGLVRATTKKIAREAGCSEALLYKHFPDKHDIFLRVLTERSPRLDAAIDWPGTKTVTANLEHLVVNLLEFYEQGFPIAASIFSNTELLTAHREAMAARGAGPRGPSTIVMRYLDDEVQLGRLPTLDTDAIAHLLTGAALHTAFLAAYSGTPISDSTALAHRLVAALNLPA